MHFPSKLLLATNIAVACAQQYAGDTISADLPTISRANVEFFRIPDNTGQNDNLTLINYYTTGSDGQRIVESNIKRAVIVLHGLLRDPWNYANDTLNALEMVGDTNINRDSVAIMAPYFPNGNDKNYAYPWNSGSTSNALVWQASKWSAGADNHYPQSSQNTSSFYVLDTLIQYFDNKDLFPQMNQIVLVGHSLGGQMLQRYAAVAPKLDTNSSVVSWIGNPDSLAWLSTYRPLNVPNCPTYDDYREGFSNFAAYPMTYGVSLINQGLDAILANFNTKQIAWARGLNDFGNQASSCAPNTAGQDRNERFFFFMKWFPRSCSDPTSTPSSSCNTVDLIDVGHDNGQMFHSDAGLARLFTDNFYGDGGRAYDFGYPRKQSGDDPYPNPNGAAGTSNYNTYAGGLTYQGCWTNQFPTTALALSYELSDSTTNTIESCTTGCVNAGYTIAGMQNSTICYCDNTMNSNSAVLTVDNECRLGCPGNAGEICGGVNRLSVFSSGYPSFST